MGPQRGEKIREGTYLTSQRAEGLFLFGSIFGLSIWPFLKLAQTLKIFNRMGYINIFYGFVLGGFLKEMGLMFKDGSDNPKKVINYSKYHNGKLTDFKVHITLYDSLGYKPFLYLFSWVSKLISIYFISKMKREKS